MDTNLSKRLESSFNKIIASNQIHEGVVYLHRPSHKALNSNRYGFFIRLIIGNKALCPMASNSSLPCSCTTGLKPP